MEETKYQEVWNLDSLFQGGSNSRSFQAHLEMLRIRLAKLENDLGNFTPSQAEDTSGRIVELLNQIGKVREYLSQATSFVTCILAQDSKEQTASSLQSELESISARFESATLSMKNNLAAIEEESWQEFLDKGRVSNYEFILKEWRRNGKARLSKKEESLLTNLTADWYHSWGGFYKALINDLTVQVSIDGEPNELSIGQAINLRSHPDEEVRKEAHEALEQTWAEKENLFARILNHIAGFRLQVYKKRGIEDVLEEPLRENQIQQETLHTMWRAVTNNKQPFTAYLNEKARILGKRKLEDSDFWAPISESKNKVSYQEAVDFIIKHLGRFGPELENFVRGAFEKGWIEAENRPNKSIVAFCAGFPLTEESRIFMTYGGTFKDVLTLTHELGHAFHNHAMKQVDGMNKQYPMSLAETASTFAEMVIFDAAIKAADSKEEKLFLLDEKLKRSVMNFMNIHSRFLFEGKFYQERKKGTISAGRLNELMEEALDKGYQGSLEGGSAHSWIWTPHFYITNSPFYNFPYTFGYLFSLGLYANAKEGGKSFEQAYLALLRDSGRMSTEQLAAKHLGEDITSETFWEKGLEMCRKDVEEFCHLSAMLF
ncbi:M3 family oligoendopeptidase [Sediminibacillus halophilus]|uniref:Oligoendopeptidase, pepF/M3 family n=1 Tax=Sediminibacillus halophilus TaxID=482461 RepID=A0A1G9V6W7_9BACI|nr:M3 family oligoendopeptidase [Sediminibacillus halophilus]SDM67899.1 oligoendopeptidase, pepF/M3 family [Sediminibacillus halophilus]